VLLVGMVVVFLLRRTIRGPGVVALMLPMHLLLDGMWAPDQRVSLLWPWAGNAFPPLYEEGMSGVWNHLMRNLSNPVTLAGELGGILVLGYLWRWCGLSSPACRAPVWKTGALTPRPGRAQFPPASSPSTGEGG
jgi:hypothetical protein